MPQDDPIFAVISRYRHAAAELMTIDELTDPARYAATEAEIGAAGAALFANKPETLAGAAALARLIVEDDLYHWIDEAVRTLSKALPQLAAQTFGRPAAS